MKRSFLLLFILAAGTAFIFAESLPEPGINIGAIRAEKRDLSFPSPELAVETAFLPDLWQTLPDPSSSDQLLSAEEFWTYSPYPFHADSRILKARLSEMWAPDPSALDPYDFSPIAVLAQKTDSATDSGAEEVDQVVLRGLLNNEYYRESLKQKKLAEETFEYGDYDASANHAALATAAARKSDEYVALRLKIRALDETLVKAKSRLDWATKIGAEKTWAGRYASASQAYDEAMKARGEEQYDLSLEKARKVLAELGPVKEIPPLPQRYKVRPWAETKDCFWTIAGYSWAYGDSTKWKILYEANKSRLSRPDNPNLLRVGTVITIPSIRGEYRDGMWEAGKTYSPLPGR